ncbi:MAG: hypothetical protein LBD74_02880 [Spirochaetaceae bacterium]|nr:hypothetical protein [Spirochaetaceae bacterium]
MKKHLLLALILCVVLAGTLVAEKPRRIVEFGTDIGVGLANNLTGLNDILKKHIYLDLNSLSSNIKRTGVSINADLDTEVFLNVNIGNWGFGVSGGVEGSINGNLPKSLFTLIAQGNRDTYVLDGDITLFGGIFADTTLKGRAKFGKLTVGLSPAVFVPLIYIPKSTITYCLDTEETLQAWAESDIRVYSPFSLEDMDTSTAMQGAGVDLSLSAEYELLPLLDLGGVLSHIPLGGAELRHEMRISFDHFGIDGSNLLQDQTLDIPEFALKQEYYTGSYRAFRPLRLDLYALYRPLGVELFTIRPNIGFTHVFGAGIPPYFNAGLEFRLNVFRIFFLHLGTGYEESLWRHRVGLAVNLRVFELDLEGGLRSQDFDKSFNLLGAGLKLGLRFGF